MIIYQIHPKHGYHMAYSQLESKYNETQGWKTVSEAEFYNRPKKETVALYESVATNKTIIPNDDTIPQSTEYDLRDQYKAKFGKEPHHRMKPESIKAALNDNLS